MSQLLESFQRFYSQVIDVARNDADAIQAISAVLEIVLPIFGAIFVAFSGWILRRFWKRYTRQALDQADNLKSLRRQFLHILQGDVEQRLDTSLHSLIKLDLYMENQRQQVGKRTLEMVSQDAAPLPSLVNRVLGFLGASTNTQVQLGSQQKIVDVIQRSDIRNKLLILGEPGSGKTTELLELAKDLIQSAIEDDEYPIPLLLELSAWNGEKLEDWIVSEVERLYLIQPATANIWLKRNQIFLLFDGLDELGLNKQRKCIDRINQFAEEKPLLYGLVICCRKEEYEAGQVALKQLNGAVYLKPLSDEQIKTYFKQLNCLNVWARIKKNHNILSLARFPLFLFMLLVVYGSKPISNESELFDAYIKNQVELLSSQGIYPPGKWLTTQKTLHYTIWLAKQLEESSKTEFLIEELHSSSLHLNSQKAAFKLLYGLTYGLIFGIVCGMFFSGILIATPNSRIFVEQIGELNPELIVAAILVTGLILGVFNGLNFGLLIGVGLEQISRFGGRQINLYKPELAEKLVWDFSRKSLLSALSFGLPVGLISGLIGGLFFGLCIGLISGLIGGLLDGLSHKRDVEKSNPNQGVRKSVQNTLKGLLLGGLPIGVLSGLLSGLLGGLLSGLLVALSFGLLFGLIGASRGGLHAVLQHLALRIILTYNGYTPWNYARFLDHAAKHRFIQRVGGRYRFVHDLLRQHFAAMPLEQPPRN
ncbi:MAG: NACHT domain-containing protein [Elainellaceae cyanobacterium]